MNTKRLLLWTGALLGAGLCLSPATAAAQRRVSDVQVSPPDAQVAVGRTVAFAATAFDATNNPIATATFVWTSSNPRAATIDRDGIATGVGSGVTIISARNGSGSRAKTGQATLQVIVEGGAPQPTAAAAAPAAQPAVQPNALRTPAVAGRPSGAGCAAMDRQPAGSGPPLGLLLQPLRMTLVRSEVVPLSYQAVQGSGDPADKVCILFAVQPGGERVAAVDSFGVVQAGDTGHTVVQLTFPGKPNWAAKQVNVEVRADTVRFRGRELSVAPGAVDTLALVVPAQGGRQVNPVGIFQFLSSDPAKVRVSPVAPIITAVAPGGARITAQSSVYPDIWVSINVHRRVARLVVTPADTIVTLAMAGGMAMSVRPQAADTSTIAEVPMRWVVDDSTVARYDTAAKVLRGLKMGQTTVTVTVPVSRDSTMSRRWRAKVVAGGLAISRPGVRVALGVGERIPVEVKILDDRRQPLETAGRLTWTSSNDSIARVDNGQILGVGMGRARLTARAPWDSTVTAEVFVVGDAIFSALRGGRWDLYMAQRGEGTQPGKVRQLTQDSALESQPAWSPTLMQIAYVVAPSPGSNMFDLYVADADGANARRLTADSALVRSPAFVRPNGDQIVFESARGGKPQLYLINKDGTGRRQLTSGDNPNTQPDVSPDGKKILFVSLRETVPRERHYNVYEMNMDGTGERRLTNSPRPEDSPAYAPDGRSFYYLRDEGGTPATKRVYRQDLTTGAATAVTPVGTFVQAFSLNADGTAIAVTTLQADANGVQTARVSMLNPTTGVMTPVPPAGADRVSSPALRPATPQH
jgi:hypothetical protein